MCFSWFTSVRVEWALIFFHDNDFPIRVLGIFVLYHNTLSTSIRVFVAIFIFFPSEEIVRNINLCSFNYFGNFCTVGTNHPDCFSIFWTSVIIRVLWSISRGCCVFGRIPRLEEYGVTTHTTAIPKVGAFDWFVLGYGDTN